MAKATTARGNLTKELTDELTSNVSHADELVTWPKIVSSKKRTKVAFGTVNQAGETNKGEDYRSVSRMI